MAVESQNGPQANALGILETLDGYRRCFTDLSTWQPYVRWVILHHRLAGNPSVRSTLPGSCPTFVVDDRWIVKFFGRLFDGGESFEAEREANRLLAASDATWPVPTLVAEGQLFAAPAGWPWPYLIFKYIPGVSIGEVYERVTLQDRVIVARSLGAVVRQLHALPIASSAVFPPTWGAYRRLLEGQRAHCVAAHREWQALPTHLVEQIEQFMTPIDALVDWSSRPHLIHADLTADHILGRLEEGRWTTLGIIDWGDAMVGDLAYELVALHLDLFRCDKRLLAAFLDAYCLDEESRSMLPARALSVALLHRFNVLACLERFSQVREMATLEELARALWDPQVPGLGGPSTGERGDGGG